MSGSKISGEATMSRRGRITLSPEPEVETEPDKAKQTEPVPETRSQIRDDFAAAAEHPSSPSAPAKRALSAGTIFKVVIAGLAVASLIVLWKNRRL